MRHFIAFIALLVTSLCSFSQTPFCAGIVVEAFPMNPQTGSYNYFGVRVTLDQAYDQNVTVNGTIGAEGNPSQSFSVTVTAGNLSAETDVTFYQADPTAEAAAEISTVSPSTITAYGTSFGTSCVSDIESTLNAVGQLHNDYQDYLLTEITQLNFDLGDTAYLREVIEDYTVEFLEDHGFSGINVNLNIAGAGGAWDFPISGYSTAGASILSDLKNLIINYDSVSSSTFFSSLNSLKSQALALSDPDEVYSVGIPVTVAIYSFNYWRENLDDWVTIFHNQDSVRKANQTFHKNVFDLFNQEYAFTYPEAGDQISLSKEYVFNGTGNEEIFRRAKCKVNLWKLGGSDVSGAVAGAQGGAALGPGGALAIGVLGSATGSLTNLANQVISCYVSWWPF